MLQPVMEHSPIFAGAMTKSMIFGSINIIGYAAPIHFLYPTMGILWGTMVSYFVSLLIAFSLFKAMNRMS